MHSDMLPELCMSLTVCGFLLGHAKMHSTLRKQSRLPFLRTGKGFAVSLNVIGQMDEMLMQNETLRYRAGMLKCTALKGACNDALTSALL